MDAEKIQEELHDIAEKYPKYLELVSHASGYKPYSEELELTYGIDKKYIKIEDLKKGLIDPNTLAVINTTENSQIVSGVNPTSNQTAAQINTPTMAEPNVNQPVSNTTPVVPQIPNQNISNEVPMTETTQTPQEPAPVAPALDPNAKITLSDIKTLVELKNKEALDNILKQIATTQTGEVDINAIVGKVANNLINDTTTSLNENRNVSTELYKYDKTGKVITKEDVSTENVNVEANELNGFNNLMVYIEAAKLYNVNYTDEQINAAKQNFINSVNNGLAPKAPTVEPTPTLEQAKVKTLTPPKPVDNEKAGFADIFILVVIVGVYAAIIINLVMKLK